MFTTGLVNIYNRNIFKTSLYIYIFQDEKCRLMRNLSLSMVLPQVIRRIHEQSILPHLQSAQFLQIIKKKKFKKKSFSLIYLRIQPYYALQLQQQPEEIIIENTKSFVKYDLNTYIFATSWCKTLISQTQTIISIKKHILQYVRSTKLGFTDILIRKSKFVVKTNFFTLEGMFFFTSSALSQITVQ